MLLADGFEEAIIGITSTWEEEVAVYDKNKCLKILMERDGLSEGEAQEFLEFNVYGAYMGKQTPLFLEPMSHEGLMDYVEECS